MREVLASISKFLTIVRSGEDLEVLVVREVERAGFLAESKRRRLLVRWETIDRVAFYKRDMLTWDTVICAVDFRCEGEACFAWINEEIEGFKQLDAGFAEHLPGYRADWWNEVVKPAFETKYAVVFERGKNGS